MIRNMTHRFADEERNYLALMAFPISCMGISSVDDITGNPSKKNFFASKKTFLKNQKKNFSANQKNFFCIKKNFLYPFTGKPRRIRRFRPHQKKLSVLVVVV